MDEHEYSSPHELMKKEFQSIKDEIRTLTVIVQSNNKFLEELKSQIYSLKSPVEYPCDSINDDEIFLKLPKSNKFDIWALNDREETYWFVAQSADDALREHLGCFYDCPLPEDLTLLNAVEEITGCKLEDYIIENVPPWILFAVSDDGKHVVKTAQEWANESVRSHLLASTVMD